MRNRIGSVILSLFLVLSTVVFNSCKKESESSTVSPPTISSTSPSENDQLANGQVLKIKGLVTDANGLSTLSIKITDDKTNAEILKLNPTVTDMQSYTIDSEWTINVNDWLTTTMTITATNKAGQKTEKLIHFKIWL